MSGASSVLAINAATMDAAAASSSINPFLGNEGEAEEPRIPENVLTRSSLPRNYHPRAYWAPGIRRKDAWIVLVGSKFPRPYVLEM